MDETTVELPAFPWAWHQQGDANDHVLLTSGSQWVIAFRTNGEFMPAKEAAIIRHLLASVNACAGISTESLEDNIPVKELATRYNRSLQQRDDLLASIEQFLDPEGNPPEDTGEWRDVMRVIGNIKGCAA